MMQMLLGLGKRAARRLGRNWILFLEIAGPIHLAMAAWFINKDDLWVTARWAFVAMLVQSGITLVAKSHSEVEKDDKEIAQAQVKDILIKYKTLAAGNMSFLLKALIEREPGRYAQLQKDLLSHAVDVAKDVLELERNDDRLAVTWGVPTADFRSWEVVAYDRNQAHRQTGKRRDIAAGIPGAAAAFLTGEVVFVHDTHDPAHCAHFPNPPYRSIISIPARAANLRNGHNVLIDNAPNAIVGVLNIDCRDADVLKLDVSVVLKDVAYIIAILEHLRGDHHVGPAKEAS